MDQSLMMNESCDCRTEFTVETVATEAGLRSLKGDWDRLSDQDASRNVFATYGWYSAWTRYYSTRQETDRFRAEVLVLRRNGAVEGISPLVRRVTSRFGVRVSRLEFVSIHSDYNQLVIGDDRNALTEALVKYLAQTNTWDTIDLRDLHDQESVTPVKQALSQSGLLYRTFPEKNACPYLPLDGDSEFQIARLSGHVRRVLRKRSSQAEREGARVRIIEHPELEPGLLETMIALECKKHLRSEFPPFIAPHQSVFRELLEQLGPRNWLSVALIERGTEAIAFQLTFRCGSRLWDYNKAYDREYSRLAPGTLLLLAMFDYGFAHNYSEYDFLRGEEEYKRIWSVDNHTRSRLLIWNKGTTSRLRKVIYYDLKPTIYRYMGREGEW